MIERLDREPDLGQRLVKIANTKACVNDVVISDLSGMFVATQVAGASYEERGRHSQFAPQGRAMKKNGLSEAASNVLIFSSVTVALMPFLLGDHLLMVVSGFVHEGGLLVNQFSDYVMWLVS